MARAHEVDLGALFTDVTRTVQNLRAIVSPGDDINSPSSMLPTCFRACGVEDVQLAAQRTGEMMEILGKTLSTIQWCVVLMSLVSALCIISLTISAMCYLCRLRWMHTVDHRLLSSSSPSPLFAKSTKQPAVGD